MENILLYEKMICHLPFNLTKIILEYLTPSFLEIIKENDLFNWLNPKDLKDFVGFVYLGTTQFIWSYGKKKFETILTNLKENKSFTLTLHHSFLKISYNAETRLYIHKDYSPENDIIGGCFSTYLSNRSKQSLINTLEDWMAEPTL